MRTSSFAAVVMIWVTAGGWVSMAGAQATVTINPANEYQSIEGFGAFGGFGYPGGGAGYSQALVDKIVGDLGISMIRTDMGETGPNASDWAEYLNAVQAKGRQLNMPVKVISTTWSPPPSMKMNNAIMGDEATNRLNPSQYAAYGEWVTSFQRGLRQAGVETYGVSFQNEPAFNNPFWSCVYLPTEYRDMIKAAGPVLKAAYPDIKIFGAEHMLANWGTFEGTLMVDAASKALMGALAVHGYSDGVNPTPSSSAATLWTRAYNNSKSAGKPLWMTETSGYGSRNDWSGNYDLARMMFAALKYGKIAAWVWWQLSQADGEEMEIMDGLNETVRYQVCKHYYRYIRPGAVMIDAISNNELVFSLAFNNKAQKALTVVLINATNSTQNVSLSGQALPSMRMFVTSSSLRFNDQGTVNNSSVSLPSNSIATLYGTGYDQGSGVADRRESIPVRVSVSDAAKSTFTISGRRLSATHAQAPTLAVIRGEQSGRTNIVHVSAQGVER